MKKESTAKLPKLTLKLFGGDPIEFQTFSDNFKSAVHENETIGKMKFNYLRNYLQGSARSSSIEGSSLMSDNYDGDQEQLLNTTNIDKLLCIPIGNSVNNIRSLREVYKPGIYNH